MMLNKEVETVHKLDEICHDHVCFLSVLMLHAFMHNEINKMFDPCAI